MLVYIGGEDFVTKQIAKRLVKFCLQDDDIEFEDLTFRDHGTRALERIGLMLNLAKNCPVIGVYDSDNICIIELLKKYLPSKVDAKFAAVNFAVDEAEAWLMADREGFAKYLNVPQDKIPIPDSGSAEISEIIPYKTSLYIIREIACYSSNDKIKPLLECDKPGKKPATYNLVWGDFIHKFWNISAASEHSDSLARAVVRVSTVLNKFISEN